MNSCREERVQLAVGNTGKIWEQLFRWIAGKLKTFHKTLEVYVWEEGGIRWKCSFTRERQIGISYLLVKGASDHRNVGDDRWAIVVNISAAVGKNGVLQWSYRVDSSSCPPSPPKQKGFGIGFLFVYGLISSEIFLSGAGVWAFGWWFQKENVTIGNQHGECQYSL